MDVISRRAMAKRATQRDMAELEELTELVTGIVEQILPEILVEVLEDPAVRRSLRVVLSREKAAGSPTPLRPAEIKAARRRNS